jgi:hypothetical protein
MGKNKATTHLGKKRREKKHRCRSVSRKKKKQGYERSTDGVAARERECAIAHLVLDRYEEEEEQQRRERNRNQPSTAHFCFSLFKKSHNGDTADRVFGAFSLAQKSISVFRTILFVFLFFRRGGSIKVIT